LIEPTPHLVDQYFNASTGESEYGEKDFSGPWNHSNGLTIVESEIKGGEGLDVTPYEAAAWHRNDLSHRFHTGGPVHQWGRSEAGRNPRKGQR
jgi:hypothetical protein